MSNSNPSRLKKFISISAFLLVGLFVLFKGAVYYLDSYAFLEMQFNRSPLYSSFLKLFTSIFGEHFEYPVIIVQLGFIIAAISYLVTTLDRHFKLTLFSYTVVLLILLSPLVYWHLTANKLLSEALAYPIFLWLFTCCLRWFISREMKFVYQLLLPLLLLLLTRGQFLALVPVIVSIMIFIYYKDRKIKQLLISVVLVLMVPMIAGLVERTYNKVVHGYFVNNAMSYVHLITADFYLSDREDETLFEEEIQRQYFSKVYQSLTEAALTQDQVIAQELDDQQFYQNNFSKLCNERVHELGLTLFSDDKNDLVQQNLALNDLAKSMFWPLFKSHFSARLKLFFKNFKTTLGTSKYLVLFIVLLCLGLIQLFRTEQELYKFMVLAIAFMLANNALIALVVHPINRYTFYFDWVLFAIVLISFDRYLKPKPHVS